MNLAIRGIDGQIENGDTFHNDRHPDLKADFVLANPPFNVSDWGGDRLRGDKRWVYGQPPDGNANFAWVQHIVHHLAPSGAAGFVLGNISLTSETGGEDAIRKGLLDANLVDCIVTLPDRLFYSTPIPAGIWILRRGRDGSGSSKERRDEVLLVDAGKLGVAVTRTHRELTPADISKVAHAYRQWHRGSSRYSDEEGFCRSVTTAEIRGTNYNLLPAAYVNRGHLRARGGPRLHNVVFGPDTKQASRSLERVRDATSTFQEALRMVEAEVRIVEQEVRFKTRRLGDLLERSDERLSDADEPEVLTCTESGGLVLQRERFAKRVATEDASQYKLVRMGDIVYNPYLLWKGAIDQCCIVDVGITSPAYEVLRVRPQFDSTIVGQLVTSPQMIRRYDGISFGTVQRRRRAPVERFLELEVNVPVGSSLAAISALLDAALDAQYASRLSERAIKQLVRSLCERLR
jgi:type I restriction enzyme M protein